MTNDYILTVFITIFTVVDPLGLIPVFIPIAEKFNKKDRKKLIFMSFFIAVIIGSIFLLLGKKLFGYLGIEFNSIYIVGGILLFLIGLDMIYARPRRSKSSPEENEDARIGEDYKEIAVFPLAIPMLAGPGTIATLIMFSSKHDGALNLFLVFLAMITAFIIAVIAMLFSDKILKILGKTGINVLDRVIGLVLCSLAVQFIINAIVDIVRGM
jgi:multiple antibiotic resistance protein